MGSYGAEISSFGQKVQLYAQTPGSPSADNRGKLISKLGSLPQIETGRLSDKGWGLSIENIGVLSLQQTGDWTLQTSGIELQTTEGDVFVFGLAENGYEINSVTVNGQPLPEESLILQNANQWFNRVRNALEFQQVSGSTADIIRQIPVTDNAPGTVESEIVVFGGRIEKDFWSPTHMELPIIDASTNAFTMTYNWQRNAEHKPTLVLMPDTDGHLTVSLSNLEHITISLNASNKPNSLSYQTLTGKTHKIYNPKLIDFIVNAIQGPLKSMQGTPGVKSNEVFDRYFQGAWLSREELMKIAVEQFSKSDYEERGKVDSLGVRDTVIVYADVGTSPEAKSKTILKFLFDEGANVYRAVYVEGWQDNDYPRYFVTEDPEQLDVLWGLANKIYQAEMGISAQDYIERQINPLLTWSERTAENIIDDIQVIDEENNSGSDGESPNGDSDSPGAITDSLTQTSENNGAVANQHQPETQKLFSTEDQQKQNTGYTQIRTGVEPKKQGPGLVNQTVDITGSVQDAKPFDQASPETGAEQQLTEKPAAPEIKPSTVVVGNQPVETTQPAEDPALRITFDALHPGVRGDMTFETFAKLDSNTIDLLVTQSKQAAVQDATIDMHNQQAEIARRLTSDLDAVTQTQQQLTEQTLQRVQANKAQAKQSFEVVSLKSKYPAAQIIPNEAGTAGQVQNNIVSTNLSGAGAVQQTVNVNAANIPMISLHGKQSSVANSYTQTDSIPQYLLRNTQDGVQLHAVIEKPNGELAFMKVTGIDIPANAEPTHYSHSAKAWVNLPQLTPSQINAINSYIQTAQQTQIIPTAPTVNGAPAPVPGGVSVPSVPVP